MICITFAFIRRSGCFSYKGSKIKGATTMSRMFKLAAIALAASLLAGTAMAQVRIQPYVPAPKIAVVPKIILIKPSQALRIAMRAVPKGKALGVQLRNGVYHVRVKDANQVRLLLIDATKGGVIQ